MTQERRADPHKTYALVVGVEDYTAGGDWSLDGPALDARRFADWLRGRGVPAQNIRLFLSPRASNHALLTSNQPYATAAATRQAVYTALMHDLNTKRGDLLYIFWSGHGMMTPEGQRRLFYADAIQTSMLNLDLNGLLTTLRSTTFEGFTQQICIVDACANYGNLEVGALPHDVLAYGEMRRACEQFVLMGAKAGDYAINLLGEQTGIFAKTVLGLLAADQTSAWPPDMQRITRELQEHFTVLRNEGKSDQTPNYFSYQDWDGNIHERGTLESLPAHEFSVTIVIREMTPKQQEELAALLLKCQSIRNQGSRNTIVNMLGDFSDRIIRDSSSYTDVRNIISTCLLEENGVETLLDRLRSFEGKSIPMQKVDAYWKSL